MKRMVSMVLAFFLLISAAPYMADASEDTKDHPSCSHCGMDREKFAKTRMLIEYDDGTAVPTCSIHCAAVDLALQIDKTPVRISVADFESGKLMDAEKGFWVIGGSRPGVMTKNGKWAFQQKEGADKFLKENGGRTATFEEAMKATYEEMYADTRMIREKRKAKRMQHNM